MVGVRDSKILNFGYNVRPWLGAAIKLNPI